MDVKTGKFSHACLKGTPLPEQASYMLHVFVCEGKQKEEERKERLNL